MSTGNGESFYKNLSGGKRSQFKDDFSDRNGYNNTICPAVFAAPVASEYCHVLFYQPKEPEGFKEFLKKEQKKI